MEDQEVGFDHRGEVVDDLVSSELEPDLGGEGVAFRVVGRDRACDRRRGVVPVFDRRLFVVTKRTLTATLDRDLGSVL